MNLSPILFNMFLENTLQAALGDFEASIVEVDDIVPNNLRFAYDIVLGPHRFSGRNRERTPGANDKTRKQSTGIGCGNKDDE